jgi:hypothetical protein
MARPFKMISNNNRYQYSTVRKPHSFQGATKR